MSSGQFSQLPRGLVLVTGPTGSGKSTTLAALIDLVNRTRADHIVTVEDPIEFLHTNQRSLVNQREVGHDTKSFANALKHVLRQDPDVILIGELRDLETISVALTAAETGHLVFATLHTQDAAQTIDRVIDVFPPHQQGQVRSQLAAVLQGVGLADPRQAGQRPRPRGRDRDLMMTPAISNLMREGKIFQIASAMQAGKSLGMHTMDQHLAGLATPARSYTRRRWRRRTTSTASSGCSRAARTGRVRAGLSGRHVMSTAIRTYDYRGRDVAGKMVKGRIEAPSEGAVVTPAAQHERHADRRSPRAAARGLQMEISIPGFGKGVGLKDLAVMSRQMATMIRRASRSSGPC